MATSSVNGTAEVRTTARGATSTASLPSAYDEHVFTHNKAYENTRWDCRDDTDPDAQLLGEGSGRTENQPGLCKQAGPRLRTLRDSRRAASAALRRSRLASGACSTRRSSRRTTSAGIYPTELDEDGARAIGRAYVEQFEPKRIAVGRDMRLSSPSMAAAVIEGAADGGRGRPRPRARRDRDGLFRGRRARARRRDHGHRLAQPEAVHGDEDRAARRAAGRRRVGAARDPRPRKTAAGVVDASGTIEQHDIWPAYVERVLSFVDVEAIRPLRGRHRRSQRDGRRDAAADPRAAADRRAYAASSSPTARSRTTSRIRCCPRTASSSSRRRSRRAPTSASRSTATPTAASSSTTRASSFPATSSPRSSPSRSSRRSRARRSSTTSAPAGRCRRRSSAPAACRSINRVGHAFIKQRMREEGAVFAGEVSGALLLPRLLAGRLRRRPVPADARARSRSAARSSRSSSRRSASATSSPARSTRPSPTSR